MRGRSWIIVIIVTILYSTACTFSSKLPTPTPPTAAPEQQPTRPQTTFIDARTVKTDSSVSNDTSIADAQALPQDANADSSGGGNTPAGDYGSGGYYGGGSHNGYGSWGGYYGYYGWYCTPSYNWGYTYWVQWGDTLNNIAWRSGTTWQALAQANCIPDPNRIYVGQVLYVPQPVAPLYSYPHYPYPHYPPPYYPPGYPTPTPAVIAPTAAPSPVVVGTGLTFAPYNEINNSTVILPPDTLITISWVGTFPTATDHVTFELIPPGDSTGSPIATDSNPADGATITWYAVNMTQGTIRGVAYFTGGYAPQYSDSYYVIAGTP